MSVARPLWAFGYEVLPAQAEHRMKLIRALLDEENRVAKRDHRHWRGRLVDEQQVTHLLIVSESPKQDREVNHRVEAALRELGIDFIVTTPLRVDDDVGIAQP